MHRALCRLQQAAQIGPDQGAKQQWEGGGGRHGVRPTLGAAGLAQRQGLADDRRKHQQPARRRSQAPRSWAIRRQGAARDRLPVADHPLDAVVGLQGLQRVGP